MYRQEVDIRVGDLLYHSLLRQGLSLNPKLTSSPSPALDCLPLGFLSLSLKCWVFQIDNQAHPTCRRAGDLNSSLQAHLTSALSTKSPPSLHKLCSCLEENKSPEKRLLSSDTALTILTAPQEACYMQVISFVRDLDLFST